MAEQPYMPRPSRDDLPRHLTHHHGYDYPYAYRELGSTLADEHRRIHEDPTAFRLDHTHSTEPKTAPDFEVYSVGFVSASVCTKLSDEETTARLNAEYPTGIESRWSIADEPTFRNGYSNPCPCEKYPETHRHILFHY